MADSAGNVDFKGFLKDGERYSVSGDRGYENWNEVYRKGPHVDYLKGKHGSGKGRVERPGYSRSKAACDEELPHVLGETEPPREDRSQRRPDEPYRAFPSGTPAGANRYGGGKGLDNSEPAGNVPTTEYNGLYDLGDAVPANLGKANDHESNEERASGGEKDVSQIEAVKVDADERKHPLKEHDMKCPDDKPEQYGP